MYYQILLLNLLIILPALADSLPGRVISDQSFQELSHLIEQFQASLTPEEKKQLVSSIDHPKRTRGFCYVLAHCKEDHHGLKIGYLDSDSKYQLHRFLSKVMSSQGYLTFLAITQRELLLEEMEDASRHMPTQFPAVGKTVNEAWKTPMKRNYLDYYIAFFGKLGQGNTFGFRLEGHHYSLSVRIDYQGKNPILTSTPIFLGASPVVVPTPPKNSKDRYPMWNFLEGHHLLIHEANLCREIIKLLPPKVQNQGIWVKFPEATLAGGLDPKPESSMKEKGIPINKGPIALKRKIAELLEEYLGSTNPLGIDKNQVKIDFLANGYLFYRGDFNQPLSRFYFRLQSDRFLYEMLQDQAWSIKTEHEANHIHSVLRDLKADWDSDVLRRHLEEHHQ